jgi:hypothetical protein
MRWTKKIFGHRTKRNAQILLDRFVRFVYGMGPRRANMQEKFYLIVGGGCVDFGLDGGPFPTWEECLAAGKALYNGPDFDQDEDSLCYLHLDENGEPGISSFTNSDFDD